MIASVSGIFKRVGGARRRPSVVDLDRAADRGHVGLDDVHADARDRTGS